MANLEVDLVIWEKHPEEIRASRSCTARSRAPFSLWGRVRSLVDETAADVGLATTLAKLYWPCQMEFRQQPTEIHITHSVLGVRDEHLISLAVCRRRYLTCCTLMFMARARSITHWKREDTVPLR